MEDLYDAYYEALRICADDSYKLLISYIENCLQITAAMYKNAQNEDPEMSYPEFYDTLEKELEKIADRL